MTASGSNFPIQKGQLNKLRLRPQIFNEHAESSREIQGTVDTNTIVGQIFKASQDNINGINLTMESNAAVAIDDFESYADSAALQVEWVEGTNVALLETTIIKSGEKSMNIPLDVLADAWTNTINSTDYTGYTFSLDYLQTVISGVGGATVAFFIGDGTNTKSIELTIGIAGIWNHFDVLDTSFAEDGGGTTDITAITKIGLRVDVKKATTNGYVDNMAATPAPGTIEVKLWNMGDTIPVSGDTSIDDGVQYEKIGDLGITGLQESSYLLQLLGGKRMYHLNGFIAGTSLEIPTNELLIPDNYYALTFNYVDTDVNIYGANSSYSINYYVNGFAFTATSEAAAISAVGEYNDCMFIIFSTQDVYLIDFAHISDATPGVGSELSYFVEDKNMYISDIMTTSINPALRTTIIDELKNVPAFVEKGSKIEEYYNDDITDSVTQITLGVRYKYIPPTINNGT